jgi:hypothetical protein
MMAAHWLAAAIRAVERGAEPLHASQKVLSPCPPIGHTSRIFPEYSDMMAAHWLAVAIRAVERGAELLDAIEKTGEVCDRIFSYRVLPLVTRQEYSQKIFSPCPPIGHTSRIFSEDSDMMASHWLAGAVRAVERGAELLFRKFSVPVLPLVTRREYSDMMASHWSHIENILI